MPLYEYQCESCGAVFEKMQKFSDDPLKVHENCGGAVHRLLSAPALQFKGSGWYITDYARGGKSNGSGKESSSESKSESKTDSKPAASSTSPNSTSTQK